MLTKDQHCLEAIIEATDRIIDYTYGFRNLVAHDYFGIDAEEVWQIIENKIPKLRSNIAILLG